MAGKRIRRPRKPTPMFIAGPPEWEYCEGISIGACVSGFAYESITGTQVALDVLAHAHNRMKSYNDTPNELFGWICVQSESVLEQLKSRNSAVNSFSDMGDIVPHPTIPDLLMLTNPRVLAAHEYAHILAPQDMTKNVLQESPVYKGHGPFWQSKVIELGFPDEAESYRRKFELMHIRRSLGQAARRW